MNQILSWARESGKCPELRLCRWIVPDVVGVFSNIDRIQKRERSTVVDAQLSIGAVGNEESIEIPYKDHPLRVRGPRDALDVATRKCVHHFHGVVAQRRADHAFAFGVEGEMVDPAFNVREWDFLH